MIYKETTLQGSGGVYTSATYVTKGVDEQFHPVFSVTERDANYDGVIDFRETKDLFYTNDYKIAREETWTDQGADGTLDSQSIRNVAYNDARQISTDILQFPDADFNGIPDHAYITEYGYDAAGRPVSIESEYQFNGVFNGLDYRLETFSYNAKGLLFQHFTEDWANLDYTIGEQRFYDSSGRVTKIQESNEFKHGDANFRTDWTGKYNAKGQLVEENRYHQELVNDTYVFEAKTKFTFDASGRVVKELTTGQNTSWQTIEKQMAEYWHDANGRETTKLTSFDDNLDGVWDAGTRTLEQWTYHENGQVATYSMDENVGDGFVEFQFASELLVA